MYICLSLAVMRWYTEQIYVYKALSDPAKEHGYPVNKSGGTTVSVKKRGGWSQSWTHAKLLAGWASDFNGQFS